MALTRILGLSNSSSLHHCRRTFSTALKHTRLVYPVTINPDSKPCSKRIIGPFLRNFCTSPVVSDDMQMSVTEDLIYSVKSLRTDVESLRTEVSLLSQAVHKIQNDKIVSSFESCYSEEKICGSDSEKVTEKTSDFSEASQDNKAAEKTSDLSEETRRSDFSEAMATHFNTKIVISQGNQAAEKISDFSEEIPTSYTRDDNEKVAAEKISNFSEEIPTSYTRDANEKVTAEKMKGDTEGNNDKATEKMSDFDTEGNNDKATEKMSDFSEAMAPQNTEIQRSDGEEGGHETVPDGKEQDSLRKEIESEIASAVGFNCVCSQGRIFPEDFPFEVYNDFHGVASVTFSRWNKSENIKVTVRPPSIFASITAENYHHHKSCSFIMPLHVEIYPRGYMVSEGRYMAFDCSAYTTGYFIENVYGFDHRGCDHRDTKGLHFSELNENLQKEFKKYLEMRGITTGTTRCMFGYMLDKLNREKLRYLSKFKELVEA